MTTEEAILKPDYVIVSWKEPVPGVTRGGLNWTCCEYHSMTVTDALRRQWWEFPSSRAQPYAAALRSFLERTNGDLVPAPDYARPDDIFELPPACDGLEDVRLTLPVGTTSITVCRTQSYITISAADGLVLHQIKR